MSKAICLTNTKKEKVYPIPFFPVGSIYFSINSENPSKYFGGTWVTWGAGRVPVGVDTSQTEFNSVEKEGGSKYLQKHYHAYRYGSSPGGDGSAIVFSSTQGTQSQLVAIRESGTGDSGNLQPYITCYMWLKTAN